MKLAERDGNKFAIKFLSSKLPEQLKTTHKDLLLKESAILRTIEHENLVRYIGTSPCGTYVKKDGKQIERLGLVLEYLSGYDLFEILQQGALG